MKKIFLIAFALLLAFIANAQQVITTTNLNLRAEPNSSSEALYSIPKGTIIVLEECTSVWCKTEYGGYTGYIHKNYVTSYSINQTSQSRVQNNPQSTQSIKYYKNSAGEKVQSPTYYNSPPAGACAVCRDGTYSFSRNRRGTCSHHGGVSRWLK